MRKLLDREGLTGDDSGGMDLRRLCRIADGSCWPILRLDAALSRATPWPASGVGIPRVKPEGRLCASCGGDCHGLSPLACGGARGAWLCSKVSMTRLREARFGGRRKVIMRPPQLGQGRGSVYTASSLLVSLFSSLS